MGEVEELNSQVAAATDRLQEAKKEIDRGRLALQASEAQGLTLISQVQELAVVIRCWKSASARSADECLERINLEPNTVSLVSLQ